MDDMRAKYEEMSARKIVEVLQTKYESMSTVEMRIAKEVLAGKDSKLAKQKSSPKPNAGQVAIKPQFQEVIVTNIDMSFGKMVAFMVKWSLASIPAMIILLVMAFLFWSIFGFLFIPRAAY